MLKPHEIRPIGCTVSHTLRAQAGQRCRGDYRRHAYAQARLPTDEVAYAPALRCAPCCYGHLASFKHLAGLLPSVNAL